VLMVLAMMGDVVKFMCILIPVLFGFMAALHRLFASSSDMGEGDCADVMQSMASFGQTFTILFEGSILGEAPMLECIHQSHHPKAGLALMYSFMILTVLLLLNMIIAMMGKTFDAVYDTAKEESATQFARSVLSWELEKGMPAPLNLLSLPLSIVNLVVNLLVVLCKCSGRCIVSLWTYFFPKVALEHENLGDATEDKMNAPSTQLVTRVNNILLEGQKRQKKLEADKNEFGEEINAPDEEPAQRQKILDDYYGTMKEMNDLREKVEDALLTRFGQWDSTNDLIKQAIQVLSDKIENSSSEGKHRYTKARR